MADQGRFSQCSWQPGLFGRGFGILAYHFHCLFLTVTASKLKVFSLSSSPHIQLQPCLPWWLCSSVRRTASPTSVSRSATNSRPPRAGGTIPSLSWTSMLSPLPSSRWLSSDQTLLGAIPLKVPAPLSSKKVGRVFRQHLGPSLYKRGYRVPETVLICPGPHWWVIHVSKPPPRLVLLCSQKVPATYLMKHVNTLPTLARVSDNGVVRALCGDWTGAHLPRAAERMPFGIPACPGPAQAFRLDGPPDLYPSRWIVSQKTFLITTGNQRGKKNSKVSWFYDI